MFYEESYFKFYCDDIESLIKEPITQEILSTDFYIPVSEDIELFAHQQLKALSNMFHRKAHYSATIGEENGEYTIFADEDGEPCYRVYFGIKMTDDLPMTLDGKLFQLASGQVLKCQVPNFFEYLPERVQNQVLEKYVWCGYEDEDGGSLHRRIDDAMWVYKNILDGTHALWKLDAEVTEAALDKIYDENEIHPLSE